MNRDVQSVSGNSLDQVEGEKQRMDSEMKRSCLEDEEKTLDTNHNDEKDLISNLPDCILAHILSKLPTKFAVGTSILSTRWKHLFSLIPRPILQFDDSLFLHPQNRETSNSADRHRRASFDNFTHRVLNVILKDVPIITTFTLKCNAVYRDIQIFHWIYSALERSPMILDIDLRDGMDEPGVVYQRISEKDSILYLALRNNLPVYVRDKFSLPNLEHLVLDRIRFPGGKQVSRTLSGCPVLKNLTMRYLCLEDVKNFTISIPSLEYLSIEHCWYSRFKKFQKVVIDTPALEFLYYEDHLPAELILNNLNSLKDARISALPLKNLYEANSLQDGKDIITALVRACSNVNKLFLSKDTISAFQISSEELPTFCNLKKLELGGFDINGWKLLARLLEKTPKLEILSITKEFREEKGCFDIFKSNFSDKIIAPCLLSSLVKLEIFELKGEIDELLLISYFLCSGIVLNAVDITCNMSLENFYLFNKILKGMAEKAGMLGRCRTRNIRL